MKYLLFYFLLINLVTFIVYGVDKKRAKKKQWRISEKTLFLLPIIGGSLGGICGMQFFRHKTKHWYFKIGMPLILIMQLVLIAFLHMKHII